MQRFSTLLKFQLVPTSFDGFFQPVRGFCYRSRKAPGQSCIPAKKHPSGDIKNGEMPGQKRVENYAHA